MTPPIHHARRLAARWLPAPVKRALRRVLPARMFLPSAPALRRFRLAMPNPPALGPAVRASAQPTGVLVEAERRSFVAKLLEEDGIAGYEPDTVAAFLAAISVQDATEVFDIGANIGVFAIVASAVTTARVTAFEPTPDLSATFRRIAQANGLGCDIQERALGASTGTATLYLSAKTDSSNSLMAGFRPASGSVEVPLERLDDVVTRLGRRPAVMKIDTEATEPDVLEGGLETLRTVRPWIVCEVLAGRTEEALTAILRPLGYRFHHLGGDGTPVEVEAITGDPTYLHRDWLFTPEPMPPAFAAHYTAWLEALRATA